MAEVTGDRQEQMEVLAVGLVRVHCRAVEEAQAALPKNIGPEDSRKIAQGLASCVHQDFGDEISSVASKPRERGELLRLIEQAYRRRVEFLWWPRVLCSGIPNDDTVRAIA